MMKVYEQNTGMAIYILNRAGDELVNTLFISKNLEKYKSSKKNAYFIIKNNFNIKDDEIKDILKNIKKEIDINKIGKLSSKQSNMESNIFNFYLSETLLRSSYISRYYYFNTISN